MAVVGIDFGSLASLIGVARHRGIDIIANEVSNRTTPSLVGFGPKQRVIGESAKTQETSNYKNTIGSLKRLIGRTLDDAEVQEIEKKFINASLVDVNGTVGVEINYVGEKQKFSATQLVGMYLGKLRDTTAAELKADVRDVVIAVPAWYTDVQRRAVHDAAAIAGLNALRLINDTTATALGWGITKSDLPESADTPRHIAFVDVGHTALTVSIVAFSKGQLTVKAVGFDHNLGGRDIDYALVQYFAEEFNAKYKIDIMNNPKAVFRLTGGCEKLKKILSANSEAPINVENIMNDVDASSALTREKYEELIAHVLDRIGAPIKRTIAESGLSIDELDAIELVGGSTRIPAVRQRIQEAFGGKILSTTLNQDEAIARGATFACAQLSPIFRVREFTVHDITPYPIKVQWPVVPTDPDDDTELLVFPKGNTIPSTKVLTFYRKDTFDIEAVYAEPQNLPKGVSPFVGKFTAKSVPEDPKGDIPSVKVKARLNIHGIMSFEQAYVEEVEEKEEPAPMDVEGAEAPAPPKKKKVVKKKEIPWVATNSSLDKADLEALREQENQMHAADKLVMDTEDRKNALEEYVYDTRGKLDGRYAPYVQPQEKEALLKDLQEAEDWLYTDEGEDASKSAYVARLDALKKLGDPIAFRYKETDERQKTIAALRETINNYMAQASSAEEKFAHIDGKDKQSVIERAATIQKWLEDQIVKQSERPKNVDPVLTSAEIGKKRDELIYFAVPILTRPKPKPPVLPTPGTETPKSKTETPNPEKTQTPDPSKGPSEMDVD